VIPRRTKIVATIGPASDDPATLAAMIRAGMDVARLNLSHGDLGTVERRMRAIREARAEVGRPVAVLLDTAGPEVRVLGLPEPGLDLVPGQRVTIGAAGEATLVPSWPGVLDELKPGDRILLDDGNLVLRVREGGRPVVATVVVGGHLVNHKKLSCPGSRWALDVLTENDRAALKLGLEWGMDWVAVSFVRSADDIFYVRRVLEEMGGGHVPLMAKIENAAGVETLGEIVRVADGIMVARGDLGVELPVEEIPGLQKRIIRQANEVGKPVVTATQMLESMVAHGRPTRAEVTDVANAIWDGSDAVMLSAETATGQHPVAVVETMARIAREADRQEPSRFARTAPVGRREGTTVTLAISRATAEVAEELGAQAIITATESGHTAQAVARWRPGVPILAVTPEERVARRLMVVWGVVPLVMEPARDTDDMMETAVQVALAAGLVEPGAQVVLTAGVPVGQPGTTNLLRVMTIGEAILRGQGVGPEGAATGEVVVVEDVRGFSPRQLEGKVLVARATDREFVPLIEQAAALIVETGGLTSHAAIVGLSLGKPTVVGAHDALARLTTGQVVTVDGHRGLVFPGSVQI
jgi:pyruvate kinase